MDYTITTISAEEYRTLVQEHTSLDIENRRLREQLAEESWKDYQALKAVKEEQEKTQQELEAARKDLESVKHSRDFWYEQACELGYGKEDGEVE